MDSDQQENAGEKTSDATSLGKTDPKEDEWKEHAKRIESDMETYAKDAAADAGKLAWMLKLSSRERKSYKEFLKRFAVVREEVSVDMDSFDYGFYMLWTAALRKHASDRGKRIPGGKKDRRTCYCNRYFGLLQGKTCAAVFE